METITRNNHDIDVEMVHGEVYGYPEKYMYCYGGRGGGKSKTVARLVVLHCWENPGITALVTRKTFPALRITAMKDTLDIIEELEIPGIFHKSDSYFQFINGSIIYFLPQYTSTGGKNERLKSLDLNVVWMEEATECSLQDFENLNPSVRKIGLHKWYFTFNPPETSEHWLYGNYDRQKELGTARRVHFGLRDNPLLPEDVIQELNNLKHIDEGLYLRFAKGEWGIDVLRERVWENIHRGTLPTGKPKFAGLDWGWNDPTVFHLYGLHDKDVYMVDEIYKTHKQPEEVGKMIVSMLKQYHIGKDSIPIYADSDSPEKNERLSDMGLWIVPTKKYSGSVEDGIVKVRMLTVYIDEERCPNGWREVTNWIYPKDKDGKTKEKPIEYNDHSCATLRYGVTGFMGSKVQLYIV